MDQQEAERANALTAPKTREEMPISSVWSVDCGDETAAGKYVARIDIYPTREAAIAGGWERIAKLEADIEKRKAGIAKKRAAIAKAGAAS